MVNLEHVVTFGSWLWRRKTWSSAGFARVCRIPVALSQHRPELLIISHLSEQTLEPAIVEQSSTMLQASIGVIERDRNSSSPEART